ncbi:hypothetical protein [Rhizobium rhizogenes]|uniref:hypothetical protein n=1 Tax=Rhizobium rhizogenes TaxID=359 RepID=UPI0004D8398A|nr:hypothetical protein [Rhizobium rhizogenes]KEA07136.1 hypothetical protein CN09_09310 [Rhizobium rhizogenes]NTI80431.1 hypothetical protein [Rhizobium rhizogenes]NTJ22617.1 hypothetical protein [Rhizobium rhizogenes]QUE81321.1 hypothetical protein EML492_05810 [Rhizobium rhizogenes]TQO80581.1 hypothetical protein FFE80_05625 [Rhizobium rhizogenes]
MTESNPFYVLLTLTGEDLDRVVEQMFGFIRADGESDATFRSRILTFLKPPADSSDRETMTLN